MRKRPKNMRDGLEEYIAASQCAPGYMDFARIGPLLRPVSAARDAAQHVIAEAPETVDGLDPVMSHARMAAASLLGFDPEHVGLLPNTSTGLFQAAFGLAHGTVLVSPFDFPSNTQPWLRAQEHGGPKVRWLTDPEGPQPHITPQAIADQLTPDVEAVTVSAVDYATGDCVDLQGIREVIGDRLLIVDAIQGFSVVTLPWNQADIVASGGQKWVRGGWSTGVLACSDRALDRLGPGLAGWPGVDGGTDPRSLHRIAEPRHTVERFAITAPDMIAAAGFAAALELIDRVGVATIERRVTDLTTILRDELESTGAAVAGHRTAPGRHASGIVSFSVRGHRPAELVDALAHEGIRVSERAGRVRVSIHASTDEASLHRMTEVASGL